MKNNVLLFIALFLLLSCGLSAQSTNLEWAKQFNGFSSIVSTDFTVDKSGNVFTAGEFIEEVDFDPGSGEFNLSATNGNIFFSKLDADGKFVWAKQLTIPPSDRQGVNIREIKSDENGNIYIVGTYHGTIDFDPGQGAFTMSAYTRSIYILKLTSAGEFVWAKQFDSNPPGGYAEITSVEITDNFIYTSGTFNSTYDFDPGTDTFLLTSTPGTPSLSVFISKLDIDGNFVWAKSIGNLFDTRTIDLSVDQMAEVYIIGYFSGEVDFDPNADSTKLNANGTKSFLLKLNAEGNFVWVKELAGNRLTGISIDAMGNIIIAGEFEEASDFNPGAGIFTLTPKGYSSIFILKLDYNSNFTWAKKIEGNGFNVANSLDIDNPGNIYINGKFSDTVDFDPGNGKAKLIANGTDIFIAKFNPSGEFVWAKHMGSVGYANAYYKTIVYESSNVYTQGWFEGTVDFDPETSIVNLTSASRGDIFIQKLSQTTTGITEDILKETSPAFPNPTSGNILIANPFKTDQQKVHIAIYTVEGRNVTEYSATIQDKISIDLSKEQPGAYIIKLTSSTECFVAKVNVLR
ncbi:MAG: T9SS type A sorting domain-containing protein [Bacteroidota bacterium]